MIDSHCHLNDEVYSNPQKYINEANANGVRAFLIIGCNLKSSIEAIKLAEQYPNCFAAIGFHPEDALNASINDLIEIDKLADNKKVVALGEIGLDYYWEKSPEKKEIQKEFFIKQIDIANKHNLPISIHCRDAYEDTLNILKKYPVNKKGILHCYSGSVEMAKIFLSLGYVFGIGGVVTFKNGIKTKEVVKSLPKEAILLETDAPYLTPSPHRGETNHSKYLYLIRDEIASLRNESTEEVDNYTTDNFKRLFL